MTHYIRYTSSAQALAMVYHLGSIGYTHSDLGDPLACEAVVNCAYRNPKGRLIVRPHLRQAYLASHTKLDSCQSSMEWVFSLKREPRSETIPIVNGTDQKAVITKGSPNIMIGEHEFSVADLWAVVAKYNNKWSVPHGNCNRKVVPVAPNDLIITGGWKPAVGSQRFVSQSTPSRPYWTDGGN